MLPKQSIVSAEKVKRLLQVPDAEADEYLRTVVAGATAFAMSKIGYSVLKQAYVSTVDGNGENELTNLPKPIVSVTHVKIDGTDVTADCVVYKEDGRIVYEPGFTEGYQNVEISFTAGYSEIPEDLQMAVFWIVDDFYSRRGRQAVETETTGGQAGTSVTMREFKLPPLAEEIIQSYALEAKFGQRTKAQTYVVVI